MERTGTHEQETEKELPWERRDKNGVFQVGSGPQCPTVLRGQVNKDRQLTTECSKMDANRLRKQWETKKSK